MTEKILFDSHTHINSEIYTDETRAELIAAIEASPVRYVIDAGFDLASSEMAVAHAEKYPWCFAAVGCHPHDSEAFDDAQFEILRVLAGHPKAVAVGEIGLDYHYDNSARDVQRYWFRRQIRLALELGKPIMIHSRDADQETMDILKEEGVFSPERIARFPKNGDLPDARLMMHCYSGSREMAEQYVKLGATISVAGPITYKNAKKNVAVAEAVPLNALLVETDAPYLTPVPFRGHENMAPYVEYTARKLAEIKGISYEEAAEATCRNAMRFFGIEC